MKHRAGTVLGLTAPLKALVQRFAFLFLLLAAFGIMLLGKADVLVVERVRSAITDVVSPIMDVLSRPAASVSEMVAGIDSLADLQSENERLRRENGHLHEWMAKARRLEAENAAFRDLLNYVPGTSPQFITARVISDSGRVFVQSLIVNAGDRDGIVKGRAVITGDGLAGRVASVGFRSARVLMITDLNSRIPVVLEATRERAILAGDNSGQPKLMFLPYDGTVSPGDRIVTSGHGGAFPPGLPVGTVASVEDGLIRVQPFVDLDRLEYIRVVDFAGPEPPPKHSIQRSAKSQRSTKGK